MKVKKRQNQPYSNSPVKKAHKHFILLILQKEKNIIPHILKDIYLVINKNLENIGFYFLGLVNSV